MAPQQAAALPIFLVASGNQDRSRAPVFVVGCPRSGTTFLYDMLLSAGGFAVYLTESNVFSVLAQRFGNLAAAHHRRDLMDVWLGSKLFRASGLDAELIEKRIVRECRNYGDFLRITMEEIARSQSQPRWAENTPEHVLYALVIKELIPDALFLHMIRDGRAVALSLDQRSDRGLKVLPWDRKYNLLIQGIYWEWIVRRGRSIRLGLGSDYLELRFEDLLRDPVGALGAVGQFVGQDLNYQLIREVGYRTVKNPNTSFSHASSFEPIDRWRKIYSAEDLATFESLFGNLLQELGYSVSANRPVRSRFQRMRTFYRNYFSARFWFKTSPIGRLLRPKLSAGDLDEIVMGEDYPPAVVPATADRDRA